MSRLASAFWVRMLMGLAVVLLVPVQKIWAETPATTPAATIRFAGEWRSTFGPLTLVQTGDDIQGEYNGDSHGTVKGKFKGRRFTFTYIEPGTSGEGWFDLAEDGRSFKGVWREKGTQAWALWEGRLAASADSFTGLWKTTFGRMRLHQNGNTVHGIYEFNGASHLTGTVIDHQLQFHYIQPDGEKGDGTFTLAPDGANFSGTWHVTESAKQSAAAQGNWTAQRVRPQPNVIWLVVLEANWEQDLAEQEYSFGVMLRTFFSRLPQVQVRHRFFGDEADFRRWCNELPFLAEPIVLHISSHGTREGVACGGKLIGAEVLAECLRDAGDLRLVHFGTCLLGGGEIPKKIHQSLGPDATFPISGYINAADWGGSAVVDFTYLELVLGRGMSPVEAVRQTTKMVTFARETTDPGDAISPAGLVIFEPKRPTTRPAATSPSK